MKRLRNLPWKRIATILVGIVGVIEANGGGLPPWVNAVAGLIAGTAINAERVMANK